MAKMGRDVGKNVFSGVRLLRYEVWLYQFRIFLYLFMFIMLKK